MDPDAADAAHRVGLLLGTPVTGWENPAGGHTRTRRGRITLADGRTAFAKVAASERTAAALRTETALYAALDVPWVPRLIAREDGPFPILITEDLGPDGWPPPWPGDTSPLFAVLDEVAATDPPIPLHGLDDAADPAWAAIGADPGPVARLGPAGTDWLAGHAAALAEAESRISLEGDDLVHADLGAENVCFTARGPVLVDWEFVARGNREIDRATVAVELRLANRPVPPDAVSDPGGWAAFLAGVMGRQATAPPPPWAEAGVGLRRAQAALFAAALDWAVAENGLPRPD